MIYIATSETVEAVKENAFAHAGVVHVAILLAAPLAAGIYRVATLPAYRDRGLGRALTVAAMQSTRRAGYATAILFATPSGFPLYQRLGFETVATAELFGWQGAGHGQ